MNRRQRRMRAMEQKPDALEWALNPETKRGVGIVFLFASAALLFLSLIRLAGTLGDTLDSLMATGFGWDRFLIPLVLLLFGFGLLYPEQRKFGPWNIVGLALFFLSFNGLLNFLLIPTKVSLISDAGGYIGWPLSSTLPPLIGFWATLIVLCALLLTAILFLFNTSLRRVFTVHVHLTEWARNAPWKRDTDSIEKIDNDESEAELNEATEEETKEAFKPVTVASRVTEEKPLTTRRNRPPTMSLDLLDYRGSKPNSGDIEHNKEVIRKTFEQFGIRVEMDEVSVGPTVTQFTLRPSEGVKLTRIVALQNDLALALAAHPLRIEAPIPGKSLVGIEIPNQTVAIVSLRELLESKTFKSRHSSNTIPLGKDVSGRIWTAEIEKMPHLLVAGATGSGKSVCLNTIIVSLLYENGPDELKFIMVDPKRVELTSYDGIPHLLVPPITKVDDTINALKWVVREMDRRLDLLSKFGARDIRSYNAKVEDKMPRIIVVIDELADLMAASGHEVEATIVRIAQMARAVGIHLVLATQRPSVDVITGTIKANFPARIAFAVASQTDSRTILDMAGAEKLLGRGDMLYTCAELPKPVRLQGAYVSESEISRVVSAIKKEGTPDYNYAVTEKSRTGTSFNTENSEEDPLLNEAAQIVIASGKASTSLLQRRLKIGYSRAARVMDVLEENGVIGPPDGAKPREILRQSWPPIDGFEGQRADADALRRASESSADEEPEIALPSEISRPVEPTLDEEQNKEDTESEESDFLAAQKGTYLES